MTGLTTQGQADEFGIPLPPAAVQGLSPQAQNQAGTTDEYGNILTNAQSNPQAFSGVTPVNSNSGQRQGLTTNAVDLNSYQALGSNPLNVFSSFNYLFTLSCLSRNDMKSQRFDISNLNNIVTSSKGDWNNRKSKRVRTEFGSYDYFIDDVIISSLAHPNEQTGNTNATKITFNITEPYSVGLFLLTLQQGAINSGYENFREAPYLLTVEFKGYNDRGNPVYNSQLNRYIPLKFTTITFKITSSGAVYECEAIPYNEISYRDQISRTLTDIRLEGSNVKEVLTTGDQSLVSAIRRQRTNSNNNREIVNSDEFLIYFPRDFTDTSDSGNQISEAKLYTNYNDNSTVRFANQTQLFDAALNIRRQRPNIISEKKNFHFQQSTKLEDIITAIIIRSDYIGNQIIDGRFQHDQNGMINWFRIEPHVEDLEYSQTYGRHRRKYIFRIIPYKVHVGRFLPSDSVVPGYENLSRNVNRIYDYTYSGKNTEILDINLDYKMGFFVPIASDSTNRVGTNDRRGGMAADVQPNRTASPIEPPPRENRPNAGPHNETTGIPAPRTNGGAGDDTSVTAQTRLLKSILENSGDLVTLEMEIRGDPYYLPSSGMGNQTRNPVGSNLLDDGSMNYQSREIDIIINFRTPLDIDPVSGLYKFSLVLDQFSGLFFILSVESKFNSGKFTQTIKCIRRRLQYGPSRPPTRETIFTFG